METMDSLNHLQLTAMAYIRVPSKSRFSVLWSYCIILYSEEKQAEAK